MIHNKKEFGVGLALLAGFFIVLSAMFSPLLEGGKNTIDYLDGLFNSISKNSAYYIPEIAGKARKHEGSVVTLQLHAEDVWQAGRMKQLLTVAGATVAVEGENLRVTGDLGQILATVLTDSDLMFRNNGAAVLGKYDLVAKRVMFVWHKTLIQMARDLDRQGKFEESNIVRDTRIRGVEPAYNYYGIKAVPMSKTFWLVIAALAGYVIYTIWYGYAILFLFENWGLKLEH